MTLVPTAAPIDLSPPDTARKKQQHDGAPDLRGPGLLDVDSER